VQEGAGDMVLAGALTAIRAGLSLVVPAGTNHNIIIINTGSNPLKLYTLMRFVRRQIIGTASSTVPATTRRPTTNTSTTKRKELMFIPTMWGVSVIAATSEGAGVARHLYPGRRFAMSGIRHI
jgi:hypothetical protein